MRIRSTDVANSRQPVVPSRREDIVRVAQQLFRRHGYQATTLDDIAKALGITRPAIYHYFDKKEDILFEIKDRVSHRALRQLEEIAAAPIPPGERLLTAMEAHTRVITENLDAITVFLRDQNLFSRKRQRKIAETDRRYEEVLKGLYAEAVESGDARPVDPSLAVGLLVGASNWLYRWFRPDEHDLESVNTAMRTLLTQGLVLAPTPSDSTP
jgi:TetR/AcrR family transcriptional regulator, cholesterol catabolism regulator